MVRVTCYLLFVLTLLTIGPGRGEAGQVSAAEPIRFGLTAVVVRENLRFLDRWAEYLSERMERRVEFVRRRTYREVMDMLEAGSLDFAWICGFPFVQRRDPEFLDLMVVPIYSGAPLYHSYVIVHKDSAFETLSDLQGGIFAFSDPDSNSGFLYPQFLLAEHGQRAEGFFRHTFYTYSHAETVEAVAEYVADGGAVDSYIWEFLLSAQPELAERTRVIQKSPPFGFPPLVSRRGVDAAVVQRMANVLREMSEDSGGRRFLNGLRLDGFGQSEPDLFDSIGRMASDTRKALLWIDSAQAGAQARP